LTFRVRLRKRIYDTGTNVSSPVFTGYGALEPLAQNPNYMTEFFTMYKRARIHATNVTVRLHNTGSEPIELVVAYLPINFTTGTPTMAEIVEKTGSARNTASVSGGMDKIIVRNSASIPRLLGGKQYLADYDFDATQAASSTPISADEPGTVIAYSAFNSSSMISYRIEILLEYDFEFYDQDQT